MSSLDERRPIAYEVALQYLIHWMRQPYNLGFGSYGYHVYMPSVMDNYLRDQEGLTESTEIRMQAISPEFYNAAWELCRRGVLRPGIARLGGQATPDGSAGNGYSLTLFGRAWIAETDRDDFVPTEPERFGQILKPFQARFGPGFASRAQEAVRCYGAHAYLACCAMCGGAAESILLATAIARTGDEPHVLRLYLSARGRSKVEHLLLGQLRGDLQRRVRSLTDLIGYWRDDAAHGRASRLSEIEAFPALAMLLRLAAIIDDHWAELMENRRP